MISRISDSQLIESGFDMKLGYILLVHERLEVLEPLLDALLSSSEDHIFVHIDKKSSSYSDIINKYQHLQNFHALEQIDVEWGEASIVYATIAGMRATQHYNLDYLILLSGSCMPISSRNELINQLSDNSYDFIECHNLRNGKWAKEGLEKERWTHYNIFNWRTDPIYFSLTHKIQNKLKVNRTLPGGLGGYMGSQWWCLRSKTARLVIDFYDKNKIEKFIKYSWIPDEFIIQSIVGNFIPHEEIRDILVMYRFNDVGIPKVYKNTDIEEIEYSRRKNFFIRKVYKDDILLKQLLSERYKGKNLKTLEKGNSNIPVSQSKKTILTDISVKNLNRVFILMMNKDNISYPDGMLDTFKNKNYQFYYQLYSSSGIFFDENKENNDSYYKHQDTAIRDYDLEKFSEKLFNKEVNFLLSSFEDFYKINYSLRKFQLITYIIKTDNLSNDDLEKALNIKKYLSSQGIDFILFNSRSNLVDDIVKSIDNFQPTNR